MVYDCTKICLKYKGKGKFAGGNKYCIICKIYMTGIENFICPCCHHKLKTKPRSSSGKKNLELNNSVKITRY